MGIMLGIAAGIFFVTCIIGVFVLPICGVWGFVQGFRETRASSRGRIGRPRGVLMPPER